MTDHWSSWTTSRSKKTSPPTTKARGTSVPATARTIMKGAARASQSRSRNRGTDDVLPIAAFPRRIHDWIKFPWIEIITEKWQKNYCKFLQLKFSQWINRGISQFKILYRPVFNTECVTIDKLQSQRNVLSLTKLLNKFESNGIIKPFSIC